MGDPKELLKKLEAGFTSGAADIKLVNDNNRVFLVYGNNTSRGVYELGKSEGEVNTDPFIFGKQYPSIKEYGLDPIRKKELFDNLNQEIDSGKDLKLIKRYDRKQLVDLYNGNRQDLPKPTEKDGEENPGFKMDFRSSPGAIAKSIGVTAYNGIVGVLPNAIGGTVGAIEDIVSSPWDGTTKFLKGLWNTAADLVGTVVASTAASQDYINPFFKSYGVHKDAFNANIGDVLHMDLNSSEEKLVSDGYEKGYTKFFDDAKKAMQIDVATPKGDPDWSNPQWIDNQISGAFDSGIEFMGGLYLGNLGLIKVGGVIGESQLAQNLLKARATNTVLKSIEALKDPALDLAQKTMLQSKIGKAAIFMEDAAALGKQYGKEVGSKTAMVLGTKYEADLEGKQFYEDYMQGVKTDRLKLLLESGMDQNTAEQALANMDFSKEKSEAVKKSEEVRNANLILLGASNMATFNLLGLLPKKISNMIAGEQLGRITEDITAPWYKKIGHGALESFKEGWEEVAQTSVQNYESSKNTGRYSLAETLGASLVSGINKLVTLDPEITMSFVGGLLPSAVISGSKYGFDKHMDSKNEKKFSKLVDRSQINSVLNGSTFNEDIQNSHLLNIAEELQNRGGQDAANKTNDWQLGHVLQMEGLKKFYYEAREGGMNDEDAKKQLLRVVAGNPQLSTWSQKLNTDYEGKVSKNLVLSEIEQSLNNASASYDSLNKKIKELKKSNIVLTPERQRNLFEAISNQQEFVSLGNYLNKQDSENKNLEGDKKINEVYKNSYNEIIKNVLNTKEVIAEQKDMKKEEIAKAGEKESSEIVDDSVTGLKSDEEVKNIQSEIHDKNAEKEVEKVIENFHTTIESLLRDGQLENGKYSLDYNTVNDVLNDFKNTYAKAEQNIKDPQKRLEYRKQVRNAYATNIEKLRQASGNISTVEDLDERYNNLESQKEFLFHAERDLMLAKLDGKVSPELYSRLKGIQKISDLKDILTDPSLSDTEERLLKTFFSEPAAVIKPNEQQDDDLRSYDFTVQNDLVTPENDTGELTPEEIQDLIDNGIIIHACD